MPNANQSCTNVAPVRRSLENGLGQRSINPVASMTTTAPAKNVALSFCPALNLPTSTRPGRTRFRRRNQRASPPVPRLIPPPSPPTSPPPQPPPPPDNG